MAAVTSARFVSGGLLAICTPKAAIVVDLNPPHLIGVIDHGPFLHATASAAALFTVVGTDTAPFLPSFLLAYRLDNAQLIRSMEFPSDILGLQLCESLLYVALESSISVLAVESFQVVGAIERRSTAGTFAVSKSYIAFSDDDRPGVVKLCSVPGNALEHEVECHKDPIRCVALSDDGAVLTTASAKGTLVRTFATDRGVRVGEFRRGFRAADVVSVSSGERVTVCSTAGTLHIFLSEQGHITVPLPAAPVCARVLDRDVAVLTVDGLLSVYRIDPLAHRAEMLTQHKLLSLSLTDATRRVRRPSTI
jgi:autophagy-related protein 18